MGMCGNGVWTHGMKITMAHQLMGVRGSGMIIIIICCAVVRGTSILINVVVRIGLWARAIFGATTALVFG
jgi:hypothetical protein